MRVLVVGGSVEYAGAPYLAGIAALRAGAESVVVMAPGKVAWAINALSPDLMTTKLAGAHLSKKHARAIREQMKTADILVLGNGAGTRASTATLMRSLAQSPLPKVVDADALKALKGNTVKNAILTPNAREYKLLEKNTDIKKLRTENVIIKKGFPTKIIAGPRSATIETNKGLAKAGTGDVLAGLCAGFLAQGFSPFTAGKKACMAGNQMANILSRKKRGCYFLASDLVHELKRSRILQP